MKRRSTILAARRSTVNMGGLGGLGGGLGGLGGGLGFDDGRRSLVPPGSFGTQSSGTSLSAGDDGGAGVAVPSVSQEGGGSRVDGAVDALVVEERRTDKRSTRSEIEELPPPCLKQSRKRGRGIFFRAFIENSH